MSELSELTVDSILPDEQIEQVVEAVEAAEEAQEISLDEILLENLSDEPVNAVKEPDINSLQEQLSHTQRLLQEIQEQQLSKNSNYFIHPETGEKITRPKVSQYQTREEFELADEKWDEVREYVDQYNKEVSQAASLKEKFKMHFNQVKNAKLYKDFDSQDYSAIAQFIAKHNKELAHELMDNKYGPHILYAFAKKEEYMKKVVAMKPSQALVEVGKMEEKIARSLNTIDRKPKSATFSKKEQVTKQSGDLFDDYESLKNAARKK